MKKLLVVSVLIGVLTVSLPVMASSPTAGQSLTPSSDSTSTSAPAAPAASAPTGSSQAANTLPALVLTAAQNQAVAAQAASLLGGGVITSQAAATAVAASLAKLEAAPDLTGDGIFAAAQAAYAGLTPAQKAIIQAGMASRNLSLEEVVGNFVKADPSIPNAKVVAWNANLCQSSVDGKAGNIAIAVSKPAAAVTQSALADVKALSKSAKLLNTLTLAPQGLTTFKTLDTAINVEGITAKDNANTIAVRQYVNGAWVNVKITAFTKGGIALHLEQPGPIAVIRLK